jgi:ankyrin repeat protein
VIHRLGYDLWIRGPDRSVGEDCEDSDVLRPSARSALGRVLAPVVGGLVLLTACAAGEPPPEPSPSSSSPTPTSEPAVPATPLPPLLAAVEGAGGLAEVRVLLARGADVDATDDEGRTAGQRARELGSDRIARLLARADALVADPGAALLRAASRGDADGAALALRSGARVEVRDERRRTPLLLAVVGDRLEVAALLTALDADPDAVDVQQDTPWLVTGVTGSVAMGQLLLPLDPDVTLRNRYGGVSIIPASERGHVAYVRWALQHTAIDVDHVNDLGWTALLEAVVLGEGTERWQRIVGILLRNGADPTIPDRDGVTALEHARARGYDEIAALLSR